MTRAGATGRRWVGVVAVSVVAAVAALGTGGAGAAAGAAGGTPPPAPSTQLPAAGMSGQQIAAASRVALRQGAALPPAGSQAVGPVAASTTVTVDVALSLPDPGALSAFVTAVSTPRSPQHGQYLTPEGFAARFSPAPSTADAVSRWLAAEGMHVGTVPADRLYVPASGPAAAVAAAFGTGLTEVRLPTGREAFVPASTPTVPSPVSPAVSAVVGLSTVGHLHPMVTVGGSGLATGGRRPAVAATAAVAAALGPNSAPVACPAGAGFGTARSFTRLARLYGMTPLYGEGRSGAGVTVGLLELETYTANDVATFEQCYGLTTSVRNVVVSQPTTTPTYPGLEAALDIEDVAALAPRSNIVVFEAHNDGVGAYDAYNAMATTAAVHVVSTSWGLCEPFAEHTTTQHSTPTVEAPVFEKMAVEGKVVFAASGDSGAEGCARTTPEPTTPGFRTQLAVDDPASQPTVTGVGGTKLVGTTPGAQTAWDSTPPATGAGGGGVSQIWTMPAYQVTAGVASASGYPSLPTPCPTTAPTGSSTGCRAVPDVSADADRLTGYEIYWRGWQTVGGTSGAAPLWAALVALTDQGCATPVGMLNSKLYGTSTVRNALTDVTSGTNGTYAAGPGYDLATGLGTPEGASLLSALQPSGGCPSVTGLSSAHGPVGGGTTVHISGSGLSDATAVDFGSIPAQVLSSSTTSATVVSPAVGGPGLANVTVTTPRGTSAVTSAAVFAYGTSGYWEVASDGGVFTFGNATFRGSMGGKPLNQPIVGVATMPTAGGYWEVASDGGIFAFGNATFFGSMGGRPLNAPIVGMAATPTGRGYWEVASDGGIFAFGNATFFGSMGGRPLNAPIVGMAATPSGGGYWEVASDGGVFTFGDATFHGSMGGKPLNAPIVGMAATPSGGGYWEVASDGGVFTFGDARFYGSMGGRPLNRPVVGMAATPTGGGYREVASDGGIFTFGDATFYGSMGGRPLNRPIVGMAAT